MSSLFRCPTRALALAMVALGFPIVSAHAQNTTTWIGGEGDWNASGNWSNGVPGSGSTAVHRTPVQVTMSSPGGQCRSFWLGLGESGAVPPRLWVAGGVLTVSDSLRVGTTGYGQFSQISGSVTAPTLVLGSPFGSGEYIHSGGTLVVTRAVLGSGQISPVGAYSTPFGSPVFTVVDSLIARVGGGVTFSAGTIQVGSGSTGGLFLLGGSLVLANSPSITVSRFQMSDVSTLSIGVGTLGLAPVVSIGPAVIDGYLAVSDVNAPDGDYEVLRGQPLSGEFNFIGLPSEDWSWRIEANSFWIRKGQVPVEPTTWSRIKAETGS